MAALPQISFGQTGGAAAADYYQLVPEAQVDGAGIFLDQALYSPAPTASFRTFASPTPPGLGQPVSFSQSDVAVLAQACASGLKLTNCSGAARVRVTRRMKTLEDSDLLELLTTTLQKEYVKNQGELELHLTRPGPQAASAG